MAKKKASKVDLSLDKEVIEPLYLAWESLGL